MKKEYILILLVVGIGVYFFMKKTPQKIQLNDDEQDVIDDVECSDGTIDECGVCNGGGAIYECGCTDIIDEKCDCEGNVTDACGVCGGTQTDASLCSGEVVLNGEGTMTWNGRDYTTQIVQYSDGTRLEWMTENAKLVNEAFYSSSPMIGSTASRFSIYGLPESMQEAIAEPEGNWEKYGGLYNKNMFNQMGAPSGWRLPEAEEFEGLLSLQDDFGYDYNINDLCATEDWENGVGGSNDSGMNFKGGGEIANVVNNTESEGLGVKGVYVVNSTSPRQRAIFNPNSEGITIQSSSGLASVRLVRIPEDVLDV